MPTALIELYEWCELHNITELNAFVDAPEHIKAVAMDISNRSKVLKLLYWRQAQKSVRLRSETRIYADEEELQAMQQCHARSIAVLKTLLDPLTQRSLIRALDVAGGDGRLCINLLVQEYEMVDHFDQCP